MRRVIAALFLAAVFIVPLVSAQPEPLAGFDALITKAVKDWRIPGLAIAVVKDGQLVFAKGYGVRELGKPDLVDTHTLFAIGSTTKAMTAALVGMLVDEKKVAWDEPVTNYLPWFQLKDPVGDARAHRPRSAHAPRRARQRRLSLVRAATIRPRRSCAACGSSIPRTRCARASSTRTSCTPPPARSSKRPRASRGPR